MIDLSDWAERIVRAFRLSTAMTMCDLGVILFISILAADYADEMFLDVHSLALDVPIKESKYILLPLRNSKVKEVVAVV